jgi:hypothetical protein
VSDWIDFGNWWSITTDDLAAVMADVAKRSFRDLGEDTSGGGVTVLEHHQIVKILNEISAA